MLIATSYNWSEWPLGRLHKAVVSLTDLQLCSTVLTNVSNFHQSNKRHLGGLFRAKTKLSSNAVSGLSATISPNPWSGQFWREFDLYGALTTWSPASERSDSIHFSTLHPRPDAMSDLFKPALSPRDRLIWVKPSGSCILHPAWHNARWPFL